MAETNRNDPMIPMAVEICNILQSCRLSIPVSDSALQGQRSTRCPQLYVVAVILHIDLPNLKVAVFSYILLAFSERFHTHPDKTGGHENTCDDV